MNLLFLMITGAEKSAPKRRQPKEVMVKQEEVEEYLRAFRRGGTADYIQPKLQGKWSSLWTIPPCDSVAAENAGRQFMRMRATEIRWIRRAQLNIGEEKVEAVVFTEFPSRRQKVVNLLDGKTIQVTTHLEDPTAIAISSAFTA